MLKQFKIFFIQSSKNVASVDFKGTLNYSSLGTSFFVEVLNAERQNVEI
jgi:hypothetical protein